MYKIIAIVIVVVALTSAKPLELVSPVVAAAPAVVTATSSQVFERNYNGIAAPIVAAPLSAAYTAPIATAAIASPVAYSAYSAYSPLAYSAYVL